MYAMQTKVDGERLAVVETEIQSVKDKVNSIENSLMSLHGKVDIFAKVMAENYTPKSTIDQLEKRMIDKDQANQHKLEEKDKANTRDRIIWIIITAAISGLIAFFLREFKI